MALVGVFFHGSSCSRDLEIRWQTLGKSWDDVLILCYEERRVRILHLDSKCEPRHDKRLTKSPI